jgi:NlpC/P60 family putative phage cell wall peptidase
VSADPSRGSSPRAEGLRAAVVAAARAWLGTPYHHMGRVKGAGVDCLMLLAEVYEAAGIVPHVAVPFYPPDWNLHRDAERYLEGVMRYAHPVETPSAGDVALFKFGRCFAHGAIVTDWPHLIHAFVRVGVIEGDATQGALRGRPVKFFSPF